MMIYIALPLPADIGARIAVAILASTLRGACGAFLVIAVAVTAGTGHDHFKLFHGISVRQG
jgi:hypothetical protein